jgi:streptogramin lyase
MDGGARVGEGRSAMIHLRRRSVRLGSIAVAGGFAAVSAGAQSGLVEKRTSAEVVDAFDIHTPASRPYSITAGPDGNLWFTESDGNRIGRITPSGVITEFEIPTPGSTPYGIAAGADGALWFTERFGDKIGRIDTSGGITEFDIPTPLCQAWDLAAGPDGNLWFTEEAAEQIGRVSLQGVIEEFPSGPCCFPTGIAAGADGNVWFTIEIANAIGRMTPAGGLTTFPIPTIQALPWDIAAGPDGNVWFTELAGRNLGRITPAGALTEFPVSGPFSGIAGVATGSDSNLWFTENDSFRVGGMDPFGDVLAKFEAGERPIGVALGPDGNVWFCEADANRIGRLVVAEPDTRYVLSMDAGFSPRRRTSPLDTNVQWTFVGPRDHGVRDVSGLQLFDTGPLSIVSTFSFTYPGAGTYFYEDPVEPGLRGVIVVPLEAPTDGTVGGTYTVRWAPEAPQSGLRWEVEALAPGHGRFRPWVLTECGSAEFEPVAPGLHGFRARLRNTETGAAVAASPIAWVAVR